jgi:adenylate kinase family enzyme
MNTLVIGYAGAGKTTYCKQNFKNVLFHDEWAAEFRQTDEAHSL